MAVQDFLVQVLVGGSDNPGIDFYFLDASNAIVAFILQDLQEFGLHERRDFSNFIKKYGSMCCQLKLSRFWFVRPGEGAFFIAKELGFYEFRGEGGAVDLDEGAGLARRIEMKGPGHQLFAHPTFTGYEHIEIYFSHSLSDFIHFLNGWAAADYDWFLKAHISVGGNGIDKKTDAQSTALLSTLRDQLYDGLGHFLEIKGLGKNALHLLFGSDSFRRSPVSGHAYNRDVGIEFTSDVQ